MSASKTAVLTLADLKKRVTRLDKSWLTICWRAAEVCLDSNAHLQPVKLTTSGIQDREYSIKWKTPNDNNRRTWKDLQYATEHGAYALSFLLIMDLTNHTIIERSRKGTGFDFWLGSANALPFQNAARLEVSGILKGSNADIDTRTNKKKTQTNQSDDTVPLPAYVVIVEFGCPKAKVIKK